jgi:hypothetical protein
MGRLATIPSTKRSHCSLDLEHARGCFTYRPVRAVCEHVFVRWDNLSLTDDESRQLPGYREPAVVRRFDAPEAMDVRFYEVRARSALNRVPERSRSPFRWTLNPYRGCTHACVYCMSGDTPILMGDGRTKPLAHVRAGDEVYGTVRRGAYRRYAIGRVLDHWSTVKPAYRVALEDGTELIVGGDHRFLTERGWKFVTGAQRGAARRPHLTTDDALMGIGAFAVPPAHTPEFRLGYLCGMIRATPTSAPTPARGPDLEAQRCTGSASPSSTWRRSRGRAST